MAKKGLAMLIVDKARGAAPGPSTDMKGMAGGDAEETPNEAGPSADHMDVAKDILAAIHANDPVALCDALHAYHRLVEAEDAPMEGGEADEGEPAG